MVIDATGSRGSMDMGRRGGCDASAHTNQAAGFENRKGREHPGLYLSILGPLRYQPLGGMYALTGVQGTAASTYAGSPRRTWQHSDPGHPPVKSGDSARPTARKGTLSAA